MGPPCDFANPAAPHSSACSATVADHATVPSRTRLSNDYVICAPSPLALEIASTRESTDQAKLTPRRRALVGGRSHLDSEQGFREEGILLERGFRGLNRPSSPSNKHQKAPTKKVLRVPVNNVAEVFNVSPCPVRSRGV